MTRLGRQIPNFSYPGVDDRDRFYRSSEALNSPAPLQPGGPPILIGGNGERRTLRLVARFADESNLTCPSGEIPRKLEALARHCAERGRDRSEVRVSWLASLFLAPTREEAEADRNAFLARRGMVWEQLPEPLRDAIDRSLLLGDPDEVGERVQREVVGAGLDGIVVNLPGNGHEPGAAERAAEMLRKALG